MLFRRAHATEPYAARRCTLLRVLSSSEPSQKPIPAYRSTAVEAGFGDGFYAAEHNELGTFHWMGLTAQLTFPAAGQDRYLELSVFSEFYDLSQELSVETGDRESRFRLGNNWHKISVPVAAGADHASLRLNKLFPREYYPQDPRTLGAQVQAPTVHEDSRRHRDVSLQQQNMELNVWEMMAGATVLKSTPQVLGIDLYGVCNVKPPCVYCDWDISKEMEGDHVDTPFTAETLEEWGEIFDNSAMLVNCSIGEPFMMKNFDQLLDIFGDRGKFLELTTNGQILTDRNIEKLLGRNINLYISLDAATPETYAKLRNDKFDRILGNLRRLVAAKGGKNGQPRIFLVFMPMQVNRHELEPFVRLCADLGVDQLILRPLCFYENSKLVWERAGYSFRYTDELLPWDELVRISGQAAELCKRYGVTLSDQLDFGGDLEENFEKEFEEGRHEVELAVDKAAETRAATELPAASSTAASMVAAPPAETEAHTSLPVIASAPQPPPVSEGLENGSATPLPTLGHEKLPPCMEPWTNLYLLRRGVLPCCYGSRPIAATGEHKEAWNGKLLQEIRHDLARGQFHAYCVESTACPIIRKAKANHTLEANMRVRGRMRSLLRQVDRLAFGLPKKLYKMAGLS
jgi:MoaA/NifB/PqqE/SkfB family radical SAM enzyme